MKNVFDATKFSDNAVECAAVFNRKLDYTAESLTVLEEILEGYCETSKKTPFTDEKLWNIAYTFGSYLGEVMLRTAVGKYGYKWFFDGENEPRLKKDGENMMFPISKVHKRLQNGSGDSVVSFYNTAIPVAQGKFNKK